MLLRTTLSAKILLNSAISSACADLAFYQASRVGAPTPQAIYYGALKTHQEWYSDAGQATATLCLGLRGLFAALSRLRGCLLSVRLFCAALLCGSSVRLFCAALLCGSSVRLFCAALLCGSSVRLFCAALLCGS